MKTKFLKASDYKVFGLKSSLGITRFGNKGNSIPTTYYSNLSPNKNPHSILEK